MSHQRTEPIIILGMHRSGTSCLAGTLQQVGLCLGDVSTNNKFNQKGNREHNIIMALNENLLQHNNASWDNPPQNNIEWNSTHLAQARTLEIQIINNCTSNTWGFKDPRALLTFPFWDHLFPNSTLIGTIRNPIDVAESLSRRNDQFSLDDGLQLWLIYNIKLLDLLKTKPFPLISFDYSNTVYSQKTAELISTIFPSSTAPITDFFDSSLRTPPKQPITIPPEIEDCYAQLKTFLS